MEYFDWRGFSGHDGGHETAQEALQAAVDEGYSVRDPGALDRLSSTPKWQEGMAAVERVRRENALGWKYAQGCISRQQYEKGISRTRATSKA